MNQNILEKKTFRIFIINTILIIIRDIIILIVKFIVFYVQRKDLKYKHFLFRSNFIKRQILMKHMKNMI